MRNTGYTLESVDNALRLLTMLQRDGRIRLTAVASELGVARSTAHRLLSTLIARGFAVQDADRFYSLGPAYRAPANPPRARDATTKVQTVAHRHLNWLNQQVGETVHLMTLEGTNVRFLDSIEGPHALRIGSRVAVTLPAYQTSGGKALLAARDDAELRELYSRVDNPPEISTILHSVEEVRRRGYGTNFGESERGITAIGMCIRGGQGHALAAVTVSAPTIRLPRGRIPALVPTLEAAVHRIEAELRA